jgi:hypothetical protein
MPPEGYEERKKEENRKDKFPELLKWFDFMNNQFKGMEEVENKKQINNLLSENGIKKID